MAGSRINRNKNNLPAVQWINYVAVAGPSVSAAASYRECRRNHAAAIGRYAFDGCREFLKAGKDGTNQAFFCAACGCHRSFHRKELQVHQNAHVVGGDGIISGEKAIAEIRRKNKEKTKRTKITEEQKSNMRRFAEKLGWKPRRNDEEDVEKFCSEVGITRKMFKVWLGNNRRQTEAEKCRAVNVIAKTNQVAVEE